MAPKEQNIGSMYGSRETSTFLGLPACSDLSTLDARIAIVGAGCATPYASVGAYCADAPRAIRAAMAPYSATTTHYDFDLGGPLLASTEASAADCGDLPFDEADALGNRAEDPGGGFNYPRSRRDADRLGRRRFRADPRLPSLRGPWTFHHPTARCSHRFSRRGRGRAVGSVEHHAPGVGNGLHRAHHFGRPEVGRVRATGRLRGGAGGGGRNSFPPGRCTKTASARCWNSCPRARICSSRSTAMRSIPRSCRRSSDQPQAA